ncbi:MAG: hypothetical protein AAGA26_12035 [Pseudomonadota bacterium]
MMFYRPADFTLNGPGALPLKRRNTLADWAFYDIGNLTEREFDMLVGQTTLEGSILVVEPKGAGNTIRIRKFNDHDSFRSAPGDLLTHFTIAGVGSSDVGAAALARTLANHLGEPVGAIVAGYGVSDLLSEALGGWFFFGAANRATAWAHHLELKRARDLAGHTPADRKAIARSLEGGRDDTETLLRLLIDPDRKVETLLGHSKGCLSIAFAFNHIAMNTTEAEFEQFAEIEIITTGAVVEFPHALRNTRQYLGAIDWFGGMNSVLGGECIKVPAAWHHVNTDLAFHMDVAALLEGKYD